MPRARSRPAPACVSGSWLPLRSSWESSLDSRPATTPRVAHQRRRQYRPSNASLSRSPRRLAWKAPRRRRSARRQFRLQRRSPRRTRRRLPVLRRPSHRRGNLPGLPRLPHAPHVREGRTSAHAARLRARARPRASPRLRRLPTSPVHCRCCRDHRAPRSSSTAVQWGEHHWCSRMSAAAHTTCASSCPGFDAGRRRSM